MHKKRKFIVLGILVVFLGFLFFRGSHFKAELKKVDISGGELAYYTRGDGEAVILLAGFGMTMEHWDPLFLENLEKRHKVIVVDYRGVGGSTGDLKSINQQKLGEDVIALMDKLKIEKADIVGWSLGSFVAQTVAAAHPDRIDKLILVATAPGGGKTIEASSTISNEIENNFQGDWASYVPYMFYSEEARQNYLERLNVARENKSLPTVPEETMEAKSAYSRAYADEEDDNKRYASLSKIKSPTLLITGQEDELLVPENARLVKALIPHAILEIVPQAGHAVLFEKPQEVSQLIEDFLKK